jgi:pyruvate/2-oxoglutarate dehydrogenase complex dihydrolipoamide dehydrogenase (E3) component
VGAVTDTVGTTVDAPTIDATTVDVVVLGAGSAGEVAATDLATAGLAVALVERDLVGGQCPFTACMPSKALLRPGTALRAAAAVPGVPVAGDLPLDVDAVLQRRDEVSDHWEDDGHVGPLRAAGVALHRGTGRITGPREVTVDADAGVTVLRARHAVLLAAGTEAAVPPIDGLDDVDVWLDAEVTTAHELPGHLVVVGGGVVGCEMATAYADLGSRVTLVQRSAHVLSGEEPTAGALVATALRERGVEVLLGREVARLVPRPDGPDGAATVVLDDGHEVTADRVLLALGRRPATDRVGLDRLGLDPAAYVSVDDRMRATDVEGGWLYAVGDVTGRSLYTHSAKHQARAAVASVLADLAGSEPDLVSWADRLAAPRVTFTDPPVAGVGRTLAAARDRRRRRGRGRHGPRRHRRGTGPRPRRRRVGPVGRRPRRAPGRRCDGGRPGGGGADPAAVRRARRRGRPGRAAPRHRALPDPRRGVDRALPPCPRRGRCGLRRLSAAAYPPPDTTPPDHPARPPGAAP